MRLLCFSDSHCTRSCEFARPTEDGLNEYLQLFIKSFEFVAETCKKEQPDILVFGGDFWDSQDYIDTMSLNVGFKVWKSLIDLPIKHKLAIVGNHDYWDIEKNIHTLEFLKAHGWYIFEKPEIISLDGTTILGLPYRESYSSEVLDPLLSEKVDVVLSHLDVVGGMLRYAKSDSDKRAFTTKSSFNPSMFDNAEVVLNGHYHLPSQVSHNFFNVGALTSRTFSDKFSDPRGLIVYDTDTKDLKRCVNPYARTFLDVSVESEQDLVDLCSVGDYSNSYAKVFYNIELSDKVDVLKDLFAGVRFIPLKEKVKDGSSGNDTLDVDLQFSLETNLENYMAFKEYDDPELLRLALEILSVSISEYESSVARSPLDFGTLSITNYQTIESLTLDLYNQGLIFLRGSNGAGKSSLIEAIYWCLTGKSLRGFTGDEVIRWNANHVRVSLEVFIGDKVYTIIRTRKDPEYHSGVKLFLGGASISARLSPDTETKLQDIIGRSEKALRHTCFMTSDFTHRFSKLGYVDRIKILEEIIESEPYKIAKERAKDQASSAVLKCSTLSGSLATMNSLRVTQETQVKEHLDKIENFDVEHSKTISDLKSRLDAMQITIDQLDVKKFEFVSIYNNIDEEIDTLLSKVESSRKSEKPLQLLVQDYNSKISVLNSDINRWVKLGKESICPTCESMVNLGSIESKVGTLESKVQIERNGQSLAQLELSRVIERISKLMGIVRARQVTRGEYTVEYNSVNDEITTYTKTIQVIKEELKEFSNDKELLESQVATVKEQLSNLMVDIEKTSAEHEIANELYNRLSTLTHKIFSEKGVRSSLISQIAIPYINSKLPNYTQYLLDGRSLWLSPKRDLKDGSTRDEIDLVLSGNHTYKGDSSGEKRKDDLAIQFALNDLSMVAGRSRIGFLVVDEVLDKIDDFGIFAVMEILKQKSEDTTILMSAHNKYAASIAPPKQILFEKSTDPQIVV